MGLSDAIELLKFKLTYLPGEKSDVVATFDAQIGGFRIRKAQLRKSRGSAGTLWMNVRGAGDSGCGISFTPGAVRDELHAMAIAKYREETDT